MSMAGMDASLRVGVYADTAQLGGSLAQAEAQVRQSASNMGSVIDRQMANFGKQFSTMLARGIGAGIVINATDSLIRGVSEALKNQRDIPNAILESLQSSFRSVPIGGALMDALLTADAGQAFHDWLWNDIVSNVDRELAKRGMVRTIQYGTMGNEQLIAERRAELERLQGMSEADKLQKQISEQARSSMVEVDTALGRFKTAEGDPMQVSQDIMRHQSETLDRIHSILRELGESARTGN